MSSYLNQLVNYDMSQPTLPSIKYLDLSIVNGDPTGQVSPVPLRFLEHRTSPYLESPCDYLVSIIRFKIDTLGLPIMQVSAQIGQSDVNKLNYSFTMKYQSYEFQQNIQFSPQDLSCATPAPPTTAQDLSTGYYNLYSYQYFIDLCNTALKSCFDGLANLTELPTALPPWMTFDTSSNEIILNADILGFEQSLDNPIQLFMNSSCHSLFSSFQCMYYGDNGVENGKNFLLVLKNQFSTNVLELDIDSTTYNIIQAYQEDDCTSMWNPVQSIVLCSSTLPVEGTMVAAPKVFNSPISAYNTSQNVSVPVLSDFQVGDSKYRPYVEYSPYYPRLIEMYSRSSQSSISIEGYWKDQYGNLNSLMLPPNCAANIKVAFYSKSMYQQ